MKTVSETIFALATPPGRGAVAVLRLSGPGSGEALDTLAGARPQPRMASIRRLKDAAGATLDEALVLWFPAPGSYTGEDGAELQLHGGRAVVEAVAGRLVELGLRLAEPGEFTRRAFERGRLDLTQAEAIADLVDAETEAQRRQALDQLGGALARRYGVWREALVDCLALLEAEIDFPDENLPERLSTAVGPRLDTVISEIDSALGDAARGERVRDGWRVAVIGPPNAGKSSLFNRLVRREAAIVTPHAGTTRDVIEASFDLGGYRVLIADTAGLRDSTDPIEAEGVRRARNWAAQAALRIWVVGATDEMSDLEEGLDLLRAGDLLVLNKADRSGPPTHSAMSRALVARVRTTLRVSAKTGEGLETLCDLLAGRAAEDLSGADFPAVTRERHRRRLGEARSHLERGRAVLTTAAELAAEDLRLAARCLGRVAGRVDPEDVLDAVFARFCIGK